MSNAVFPTLPGLKWGFTVADVYDTLIYEGTNPGYETRISKSPDPILNIKLEYDYLREYNSRSVFDFGIFKAFFRSRQGAFDSFLLDLGILTKNSEDDTVLGQTLTVDANNYAPLVHTLSSYNETVYEINVISNVYGNGVAITYDGHPNTPPASGKWNYYNSSPTNTYGGTAYPGVVIQFGSTPSLPVTADFTWYYRVRFEKDNADYDAFLYQLYELKEINLITVRNL